jgi:hypothetical protein
MFDLARQPLFATFVNTVSVRSSWVERELLMAAVLRAEDFILKSLIY